jgi:hypothetical protein
VIRSRLHRDDRRLHAVDDGVLQAPSHALLGARRDVGGNEQLDVAASERLDRRLAIICRART